MSGNEIARRLNVASSTVRLTLQRLAAAGLHWPLPAEMTDTALEAQLLLPSARSKAIAAVLSPTGWLSTAS